MLHAFVLIEADPPKISELASRLAELDGVAEAYSVAGQSADIVAVVRVPDNEMLAEVVTNGIAGLEGVRSTSTLIAFRAFSRHDLEVMFDIGNAG
jgi:DNA-binding Lrp family transcriptional regulator